MSQTPLCRTALVPHRAKLVGLALLCVALASEALTLGRIQGAALVGQPLNLVVPVQIEAGETAAALCFEADVFHADTRQDASRVRVRVEAGAQPASTQVRIMSSAAIDEPVVTVYLRTGCGQQTTRRYLLLADLPSAVALPSAPSVPVLAPPATRVPPGASALDGSAVSQARAVRPPKPRARPKAASKRRAVAPALAAPSGARPDRAIQAAPSAGGSRLTLDPLEFLSDRISNLDFASPIATPEDVLQNKQKIQVLEGSVSALQALAAKNEATVLDLKARLQQAQSTRFSGPLVYGLIVLLLACLAALTLLWQRQRRLAAGAGDWWRGASAAPAATPAPAGALESALAQEIKLDPARSAQASDAVAFSDSVQDFKPSAAVDVKLMDMSDSYFNGLLLAGTSDSAKHQSPTGPTPVKVRHRGLADSFHTEALLDIRQQAEFFVSLGQPEQAVRILKRQIQESEEPNPFIYLDLLGVLRSLGQKDDFQRLRQDFNRYFKGRVPEFVLFTAEGRDLQAYPELLSRITQLWATPQALALLESCIFKESPDATSQAFDLAAFRDLLLLHTVAPRDALAPPVPGLDIDLDLDLSAAAPGERDHSINFDLPAASTPPRSSRPKPGSR